MRRLLLAVAVLAGCYDFGQFRRAKEDTGAGDVAVDDLGGDADADGAAADAGSDGPAADQEDAGADGGCNPRPVALLRLAHMAYGVGAVDWCALRSGSTTWVSPRAGEWPAAGLGYTQVSQRSLPGIVPAQADESWTFNVALHGTPCPRQPIATAVVRLNPVERATLLLTSQLFAGHYTHVATFLPDRACAQCPAGQVDVRGVHAAFGASSIYTDLALGSGGVAMPFATAVGYGGAEQNLADGYVCPLGTWQDLLARGGTTEFSASVGSPPAVLQLARTAPAPLRSALLQRTRTATVFFEGAGTTGPAGDPEAFVVCYDGNTDDGGLAACDRFPSVRPRMDAGRDATADVRGEASSALDAVPEAAAPDAASDARPEATTDADVDAVDASAAADLLPGDAGVPDDLLPVPADRSASGDP